MKVWTSEALTELSDDDLLDLYDNCERKHTNEALEIGSRICKLIVSRDKLSVGETGLKLDSPVGKLLVRLINSPEGVSGAIVATSRGEPALAGIEPMIVKALGPSYSQRYEATIQAGFVVGKMMQRLGHKKTGKKGQMPPGSVATTAEIFALKE